MSRTPRLEPNITWPLGASVMSASTSTALHMVTFCTGPPLFHVEHTSAPLIPERLQVPWGLGCAPLHPRGCGALRPGSPDLRTKSRCPASALCCHVTPGKQPQGFSCSPCSLSQAQRPAMHTLVPTSPVSPAFTSAHEARPVSSLCRPHRVVTCPQSRTLPPAGAFQVPGLSSLTSACSFMPSFSHSVGKPRRFLGLGAGSAPHSRARAGHRGESGAGRPALQRACPHAVSVPSGVQ